MSREEDRREQAGIRRWYGNEWVVLAGILLVGLGLRLAYLHEIVHEPTFAHAVYDPQYNDYWARGLVTGDWTVPEGVNDPEIRTTPHGRPPGYPHFLAAVYWVFGTGPLAPRLVQMALGLANCVLMFLLGRALFGRATGLVAAAFMATYWAFIYFEGILTYPAVVVFLLLCLMHALRFWHRKPAFWRAMVAGLLLGAFGLFRPNGLLYGPVLVAWMFWALRHGKAQRRFAASAIGLTLGTGLALTPTTVRDYVVAHDVVFVSSYGGLNLYVGNHENASCVEPRIPELKTLAGIENWSCFDYPAIVRGLRRQLGRPDLKFSEASAYFARKAWDFIVHHPRSFVRLTGKKALLFWGPAEVTNDTVLAYDKRYSPLLRYLPGFPWAAGLFALGALMWLRGGDKGLQPLVREPGRHPVAAAVLLFVPTYFASVIPFFIAGRYRVPVTPFLLLFGAYGVVRVAAFARERRYVRVAGWCVAGLGFLALASWNVAGYEPSEATWHFRRALACEASGDAAGAMAAYRTAAACGHEPSAAHGNLARLLIEEGQPEEAIAEFEKGLSIAPDDSLLENNLGYELARLGRLDEAVAHYEAALRTNPLLTLARTNLGHALMAQGKPAEALEQYERVAALEPERWDVHNNLGYALARLGRLDEAVAAYTKATSIDPKSVLTRLNLGNALLELARFDAASAQFEAVAALEPGNKYAYYNLGLVSDRTGQLDEAAAQYEKALECDGEYADAHNNLGYVLARQGKLDAAVKAYEAALESDPQSARAHVNLGRALEALGNAAVAVRHYEQAIELDPSDADTRTRLDRLRATTGAEASLPQ